MRKNYIITFSCAVLSGLILMSSSSGLSEDRTNAPSSNGNCSGCHSGGNFNALMTIAVTKKGSLAQVSSYQPDSVYTVAVSVATITSLKKGFQATILNSNNQKSGDMSNAGSGCSIQTIGSRQMAGHNSGSSLGVWTFDWKAPSTPVSPNSDITIYASGNATDSKSNTTGDQTLTTSKTLSLSGTASTFNTEMSLSVYPNPAADAVYLPEGSIFQNLIDISGKTVEVSVDGEKVNLSNIAQGFYFVRYSINGNGYTVKIRKN